MFKRITIWLLGISVALSLGSAAGEGQPDPLELLECARENWVGVSFHGTILLQLFRPAYSTEYRMEVWSEQGGEPALIRIREPASEAGSGYLLLEDGLWYYTPEGGEPIHISESSLTQRFLGSDLALEDVYRGTLSEDYEAELLGTRPADGGDQIHRVRLTPRPEAPVVYGGLELDIRGSDCAVLLVDYYDQRETLIREATFSEFVQVEGDNSRVIPLKTVVNDLLEDGSYTVEEIESYEFGISIPPERFTLECLVEGEGACGSS
jgi:hypothetical protein